MLTWACTVYDATVTNHPSDVDADGSGGAAGTTIAGGAAGALAAGTGGNAGESIGSDTTGSAGASSTSTSMGSGGSAGSGSDADASSGGSAGSGGAGSGGAAGNVDAGSGPKDQASEPVADAKPDAAPDTGCSNPTLCMLKAALVHRYRFDGTGTKATDSVGTAHGTVVNAQLSGSGTVVLAGGSTDQYVDLPNGIVKSLTDATFEVWVTWTGGAGWQRIFDFGNSSGAEGTRGTATTTLYLTPQATMVSSFPGPPVMLVGFKRSDVTSDNESHVLSNAAMATGMIVHVALVVDDTNNQLTLYKNGSFESSIAFADSLSLLNDVNNWLGRSQYSADSGFAGTLHDFRIYGAALSQSAVLASYLAGPDATF